MTSCSSLPFQLTLLVCNTTAYLAIALHDVILLLQYWEKAEFPFHVIPKLATLGLAGGITKVQTKQFLYFRMFGLTEIHKSLKFVF